jgi:cytochrome c oxidase subunit 4
VPAFTLRAVLTILLFFTLLTVGAAQIEMWVAHTFNIVIPQWVNVFVALSIATVKTVLVVMFFMQLKYDNPMNSLIFVFTVLTVAFFLGFTALDLGKRGTIDRAKANYIIEGGTGLAGENKPITQIARERAIANNTYDPHHAHHAHHGGKQSITDAGYLPAEPAVGSSSNKSRPVTGVTLPGLPGAKPAGAHDDHGHAAPAGKAAQPAH